MQATSESHSTGSRRPWRSRLLTVGAASMAVVAAGLPGAAGAAPTPAVEQTWETGTIAKVDDGDTVFVDVTTAAAPATIAPASGTTYCANRVDATTGAMPPVLEDCRVRIVGVQTPEEPGTQGSALGQCGALEAHRALAAALPTGTPVQLRSINVTSVERQYQGGRLARSVFYEQTPGSGVWVDASTAVMSAGLGMWMPLNTNDPEKPEYSRNLSYRELVDAAASARAGLFSGRLCNPDGALATALRMYVVSDPPGDDAGREYVVIYNDSDLPQDIGGWTLRDSSFTYARFATGTAIPARDYVIVRSGLGIAGLPTARDHYFNASGPMFANFDASAGYFHGDGVYLYANDTSAAGMEYGDLRAWHHYPCLGQGCNDELVGKLVFTAVVYDPPGPDTAAGEYVEITNRATAPVRLGGYQFRRQNTPMQFAPDAVLAPGATLRISMGVGVDTPTTIHMGRTSSLLANVGDLLFIERVDSAVLDCRAWGTMSCPPGAPVSGQVATTPAASSPPTPTPPATATVTAVTTVPAKKAVARPSAPLGISATSKARRITVRWTPPAATGSSALTKFRARAYQKSGSKLKVKATCYAKASKLTCRTKKLKKGRTYLVKVAARNKKGYGPTSAALSIRVK